MEDELSYNFPLTYTQGNRYLTDQNGTPFFINGDTAWGMITQLSASEVITYLDDRQSRGFNSLIVELLYYLDVSYPYNKYYVSPFTVSGDFSTPNETYFAYVDWIISACADRNMVVFLFPMYLGYQFNAEGWGNDVLANGTTKCSGFGEFLGNRYKNYHNIVWVHGGDVNASTYGAMTHVDYMVSGIKAKDIVRPKLHSAHDSRGNAAYDNYNRPWLTLNSTYSEHLGTLIESKNDYQTFLAHNLPFFFVEGRYENDGVNATQINLRKQFLWNVLSGSTGHFFGNCPIWHFSSDPAWCSGQWTSNLNTSGSIAMQNMTNFFTSIKWWSLVPDLNRTTLTSGYDTSGAVAAHSSDKRIFVAYFPFNINFLVDLTQFTNSTKVVAFWINPYTNVRTPLGIYSTTTTNQTFSFPSTSDWILYIIDYPYETLPNISSRIKF